MLAGATGFAPIEVNGQAGRVIYQPIATAGWSLGVFYPEQELMAGAERLRGSRRPSVCWACSCWPPSWWLSRAG